MVPLLLTLFAAEPYRFLLDGKPLEPQFVHVVGTPAEPHPDDLLLWDFPLPLGAERVQRFVSRRGREDDDRGDELWQDDGAGGRRLVGVTVRLRRWGPKYKELPEPIVENPLAKMSPAELKSVRAVRFEHWDDACPALLAQLDHAKVHVVFRQIDGQAKLPALPPGLRHLQVEENSNGAGWTDFSALAGHPGLLSVDLRVYGKGDADLSSLRGMPLLRRLELSFPRAAKPPALADLPQLRHADVASCRALRSVAFVAGSPKLETLRLAGAGVRDLTPLGGHPALREIDARESAAELLPAAPMPAATKFLTLGSMIPPAAADAFRKANPQCVVEDRWNALFDRLAGIDRIRIRSGGTCHRDIPRETTLAEETDPAKLKEFLAKMRVREDGFGRHCMCCGEPTLEFYREGKLIAAVGHHHGHSLRWQEGWTSDVAMAPESATFLAEWLAQRVPAIRAEQQRAKAEAAAARAERQRFLACFPKAAQAVFADRELDEAGMGRALAAALPDPIPRVHAFCKAFDVPPDSGRIWNSTDQYDQAVLAGLKLTPPAAWRDALDLLREGTPEFRGAARLWLVYQADEMLPAAERPPRQVRFARAALASGQDEIKVRVVEGLGKLVDAESAALLLDLLRGRAGKAMAQRDFAEPDLPANAALALARRNVRAAEPDIRKLAEQTKNDDDRDALHAALALLGDPAKLSARMFRTQSHVTGLAAIAAVERFRGAHGLELLVKEGLKHPWARVNDEAGLAAQRLIGKSWEIAEREDKLQEWWNAEGAAFVARRRAQP